GRMRLGADEPDRALGVVLADAADGGGAGHASADDQVAVRAHGYSFSRLSVSNVSRTRQHASGSRHPRASQVTSLQVPRVRWASRRPIQSPRSIGAVWAG